MAIRLVRSDELPVLLEMCHWFTTSPFQFDDRLDGVAGGFEPAFGKEMLYSPSTISYVDEENTTIRGFISFHPLSPLSEQAGKRIGNILLLVVRPEHRGKGIAKTLVQRCLDYLRNLRVDIVTVGTDLYNIPALQVYTSQGFYPRLAWHIFRFYYDHEGTSSPLVRPLSINELSPFEPLFSRPLSLLKDTHIQTTNLRSYLVEKWKNQLAQGRLFCLGYCPHDSPQALLTLQQDSLAEKTLKTQKPVYKILDVIALPKTGNEAYHTLLRDAVTRFPASLVELWVDATNTNLIQCAEEAGFRLAYSGISLHAYL